MSHAAADSGPPDSPLPDGVSPDRTRVLIVDDSDLDAQYLARALSRDARLHVVGHAIDAWQARDLVKELEPDVVTLDLDLPGMHGLTFLQNLMRLRPLPVVVVSGAVKVDGQMTLDALECGAVDVISKQRVASKPARRAQAADLAGRVLAAASVPVRANRVAPSVEASRVDSRLLARAVVQAAAPAAVCPGVSRVICIGASTGGPDAVRSLMSHLHVSGAAVAIAQHMAAPFVAPYAERLDRTASFEIAVATDGEPVVAGRAYVAPGDRHLSFVRRGDALLCRIDAGSKLQGHRPSVDRLFASAADTVGAAAIGIVLTGMGSDGAAGLQAMHERGAMTFAQDRNSSAVWGMPGRAVASGTVNFELAPDAIGRLLTAALRQAT